jgi:hypothetical protein
MVALMILLGIVLFIGILLLAGALQTTQAVAAAHLRMRSAIALADQFRSDVASATEAPDRGEGAVAGPACLVLRKKEGLVIYRWKEGRLSRSEEGAKRSEAFLPLGPNCTGLEFRRWGPENRLITLRLTETGRRTPDRITELSAALGGDLR